ncbi:DNA primase [Lujinxingia litoralis]|uniref:DNA primase n=1 Tax=Lujinxingia litoralis TaxID=2211119 RepID=A0A328CBG9_9DELT|nr:DNA primase [Lujinxingia litoralis]RAL23839.1 DNA primase [Lujinxingia litoralis]
MGLIPQSVIEDVLARTDILQTIQQYVSLKRAGHNYKGLCPFHEENTPSFNVHPGMGIYKCFGCSEGGNVIQFLMSIEGWSFPETVRTLAERAGVEIPEESPQEAERARKRREGKKAYLAIMGAAREFYEAQLWGARGEVARRYLAERGIDEATARRFGLGYAPEGWDHTINALGKQGYKPSWLERAGLVIPNNKGGFYDRFRHRVVFPVVDVWGNTLAFGGRALASDGGGAKYINSPETSFYTKGEQLYGLEVAKSAIGKEELALVVEGNFDVIALHGAGVEMTVAPMGTALTEVQARLLKRYARRVVIAFDGDSAGEEATLRCLGALESAGLEALVVRFDEADDPDTFVRREGAQALRARIEGAQPLAGWAIERVIKPVEGATIEARIGALEEVSAVLNLISEPAAWEHYAREIARRLSIDPALLKDYLKRPAERRDQAKAAVLKASQGTRLLSAEYGVLAVLLDQPVWLADFFREELDKLLFSQELADFLHVVQNHYQHHQGINRPLLLEATPPGGMRQTVIEALAEVESQRLYAPDEALRWYRDCVRTLKKAWAVRMDEHLQRELEGIDFRSERERFAQISEQLEQVRQFRKALDLDANAAKSTAG